jgi:FSR family fosmidomycin resistance protein-like MFS transporter
MSLFSVGGNTGFALAPLLITPAVLAFGLEGTVIVAILPTLIAVALAFELPHLKARSAAAAQAIADGRDDRTDDDWGAFSRLAAVVGLRSGVYFGLQSFGAVWLIQQYGASEGTGNAALAGMLAAGALGTLVGGRLVDRVGRRRVLVGSIVAQIPLLLGFMLAPNGLVAALLLAAIGFVTVMSFSVSVVMGQEYLPSRLGIASGVTLGLAIGLGGIAAALLGVLADHSGLSTVMWTIALLPLGGLAIALTLPLTAQEARLRRVPSHPVESVS